MTKLLTSFGLTRDSALFLWTKIAGIAGLVVAGAIDPHVLGLTDKQAHILMVVCGAIAYLSGQLSTSSLAGAPSAKEKAIGVGLVLLLLLPAPARAQTVAAGVFHNCGLEGKAEAARVKPLNVLKNRATAPATVDSSITLERLMAAGDDRARWSTDQAVTITGLVVEVKPGGVESVNCGATDARWKDTHIGIVVDAKQADTPLIVEVTPRWREAMRAIGVDWSTATLKRELFAHEVRITGWLFRDDEHLQNAVNTNPHGTTLWRQTVFEVHPVTAIDVLPTLSVAALLRRR